MKDGRRLIYRFKRLPAVGEYSNELTAEFPDGVAFDEAAFEDERSQRRMKPEDRKKWGLSENREPGGLYRVGDSTIPQWKLLVKIDVEMPPYKLPTGVPYPSRR